jgi:hypothetical protein
MNAKQLVLSVLAMGLAGAVQAGGGAYPEPFLEESAPAKSRAEVIAEVVEAQRLGLLTVGEEDIKVATPEQERMIAEAGRRAAEQVRLAKGDSK